MASHPTSWRPHVPVTSRVIPFVSYPNGLTCPFSSRPPLVLVRRALFGGAPNLIRLPSGPGRATIWSQSPMVALPPAYGPLHSWPPWSHFPLVVALLPDRGPFQSRPPWARSPVVVAHLRRSPLWSWSPSRPIWLCDRSDRAAFWSWSCHFPVAPPSCPGRAAVWSLPVPVVVPPGPLGPYGSGSIGPSNRGPP
jgi:hypothetical protein